MTDFEYGIAQVSNSGELWLHRTGMNEEDAHTWLTEFIEDGGKPKLFRIIRRPHSDWTDLDGNGPVTIQ